MNASIPRINWLLIALTMWASASGIQAQIKSLQNVTRQNYPAYRMVLQEVAAEAIEAVSDPRSRVEEFVKRLEAHPRRPAIPTGFGGIRDAQVDGSLFQDAKYIDGLDKILVATAKPLIVSPAKPLTTSTLMRTGYMVTPCGGQEVDPNAYLECVAISDNSGFRGIGVIYENGLVITAAHIWDKPSGVYAPNTVWIGLDVSKPNECLRLRVRQVLIHPKYQHAQFKYQSPIGNDLMLLKLTAESQAKVTQHIEIASSETIAAMQQSQEGVPVRATGFSEHIVNQQGGEDYKGFNTKRTATVGTATFDLKQYPFLHQENIGGKYQICEFVAAATNACEGSSCHGDSGGPVYVTEKDERKLVGIVSGAADGNKPCNQTGTVYTLLEPYRDWLKAAPGATGWIDVKTPP
ncbi:MAG: trypsin-like serine protease [Verrucomicrobiaceae bacterium]